MTKNVRFWVFIFTSLLVQTSVHLPTQAFSIGPDSFGASAVVESFEGLSAGPNITSGGAGYLEPGVTSPFLFDSGVVLTGPIPNPGRGTGVLIADWSIAGAPWGFDHSSVLSAGDVPFGTAFIGLDDPATAGPIEFSFSTPMLRVGGFVTADAGLITLQAYGSDGGLLESTTIDVATVALWPTNFIGLENAQGIVRVDFNGDFVSLDGLTFQAIPEPTTSALALVGLCVVYCRREFLSYRHRMNCLERTAV